eukprot:CAMPEP_0201479774 /NCGR_PEP_ID=MMETSP0151_2-20130828/4423_1 /ASSEMBLY_ACC=CAM_ASM_000257 /TAXON_ID=200890 /ORGANISM="Paramoeba atlantica, Strain 621/1 / CCAP 1560/9" /LENGTH=86 /DNA_ID=CAMNT_0047861429 /DNA_START=927 /DNA_END=1187 /DNA_ORIENTATION=-
MIVEEEVEEKGTQNTLQIDVKDRQRAEYCPVEENQQRDFANSEEEEERQKKEEKKRKKSFRSNRQPSPRERPKRKTRSPFPHYFDT